MKKEKLTKQQKLKLSQDKALALQRKLDVSSIRRAQYEDKMAKETRISKCLGEKKSRLKYAEELGALYKAEDKAYSDFRNHMHKEFGRQIEKSSVSYTSKKYKAGFVDRQYVKDMYAAKQAKIG